jgi:hypothetical protein
MPFFLLLNLSAMDDILSMWHSHKPNSALNNTTTQAIIKIKVKYERLSN